MRVMNDEGKNKKPNHAGGTEHEPRRVRTHAFAQITEEDEEGDEERLIPYGMH